MEIIQSQPAAADFSQQVLLPECSDLGACASIKDTLMDALAHGGSLQIDASLVRTIGTPMMQVLAAAKRSFTATGGCAMTIVNRSERFCEVADMLGFTPVFDGREN